MIRSIIANEKQAHEATETIDRISHAISSHQVLQAVVEGLPPEVIEGVRRLLNTERSALNDLLGAYNEAKKGKFERMWAQVGGDPGTLLIVARVARGWSQKELGRRLFLPEQQVQRYEAQRYRSISLGDLIRVARTLGVDISADLTSPFQEQWLPSYEISQSDAHKLLKHARTHGWLTHNNQADDNALSQLKRVVAEHVGEHGTPSLLRTGLNVHDHSGDWFLLAWKAQVTRRAVSLIQQVKPKYRPWDVSWLKELVRLSAEEDGPARARSLLEERGIILIVEPQIVGMNVDGAAFLVDETPVIGLTLRHDRLDNFWFTLLHEIAHVLLHYRTGLSAGFFDNVEVQSGRVEEHVTSIQEFEDEADRFADNLLIPDEIWSRSPARISRTSEPIEALAKQLGISPAVVFGRIRMERNDYKLFSNKIGLGKVREQLSFKALEKFI
jgi:HTH-type transcriptional regulator / antitoxin HigA